MLDGKAYITMDEVRDALERDPNLLSRIGVVQFIQPKMSLHDAIAKAAVEYRRRFGEIATVAIVPRSEEAAALPPMIGKIRVLRNRSVSGMVWVGPGRDDQKLGIERRSPWSKESKS